MNAIRLSIPAKWKSIAAVALAFWALFGAVILVKSVVRPDMHSVYPVYAAAGRTWWFPDRPDLVAAVPAKDRDLLNRQYAPFFAQLIGPFCAVSDRVGGTAWSALGIAVFLTGFHGLLHRVVPGGVSRNEWGAALLIVPWFGITSLYNGQANVLIAGSLLWAVVCIRDERWALASVLLALPTCIKSYPAAMAMTLIVLYPRKLAWRYLAAVACLSLLAFVFHPWETVVERYRQWFAFISSGAHYSTGMNIIDLRTFLSRWLIEISPRDYMPVQALTGGLALACALASARWGRHSSRSADSEDTGGASGTRNARWGRYSSDSAGASASPNAGLLSAYVMVSLWMTLFGPATEEATYLLAGPAITWILLEANRQRGSRITLAALAVAAVFAGPLQTSILGETVRRWVFDWRLAPLALAVLFCHEAFACLRVLRAEKAHVYQSGERAVAH